VYSKNCKNYKIHIYIVQYYIYLLNISVLLGKSAVCSVRSVVSCRLVVLRWSFGGAFESDHVDPRYDAYL